MSEQVTIPLSLAERIDSLLFELREREEVEFGESTPETRRTIRDLQEAMDNYGIAT